MTSLPALPTTLPTTLPATLPSPVRFCADALARDGALVEVANGADGEEQALAILPSALATRLALQEEVQLAPAARTGAVACGLGTGLLDRLVDERSSLRGYVVADAELAAPRASQAEALAARFALRNAVVDVGAGRARKEAYAFVGTRLVVEADDRDEAFEVLALCASDGAAPDSALVAALALDTTSALRGAHRALPAVRAEVLPPRLRARLAALAGAHQDDVARRHRRDHERVDAYFHELIYETRTGRKQRDPAAVKARVEHLENERAAKLAELRARYTLRARATIVFAAVVEVPTIVVDVRVRRRKEERVLSLHLPSAARTLDVPACDGCLLPAARPAVCDDKIHLLCERCAPSAQGRLACPVCGR